MHLSLSIRLLGLTIGAMLLTAIVLFVPGLAQARHGWLNQHIRRAELAGQAATTLPEGLLDDRMRADLLRLADARLIRLHSATRIIAELAPPAVVVPTMQVDVRRETYFAGLSHALSALFFTDDGVLLITAIAPMQRSIVIEEIVRERGLSTALRSYARRIAELWLTVMLVTGTLLYLALLAFLVRPMQRLTRSIAAFRGDPDQISPFDGGGAALPAGNEMAIAAHELTGMQVELRNALWRNARLAALGTTLAKVSHDLRGILATAMLTADRLTMHSDPAVAQAGETLVKSVERATSLVRQTLDLARDSPAPPARIRFPLRALIEDAASALLDRATPRLDIGIDAGLVVEADREQMLRVMANLIRNAGEAGASNLRIGVSHAPPMLSVRVEDDGPGLPEAIRTQLFRPFVGSRHPGGTGLGLAIVRDLMRAQGGDAKLVETSATGTTFELLLPWRDE